MSKTIYIGGRLESKEKGNVVTGANAILDDTKGKKQNVINKETDDELLRLEQSKQDNLSFDNAPTEDSTNPVTSGGVYTAEKALSDAIEAILLLIPSAATALNKLVDTNTMNSSISTATATFRGTYNAVSDLGLTYQATHAQIEAALDALGLTADNNDFVFVQIPVSDQSQDIAKTERFKFNGTNWLYEYDLNTSGFTAAQWAAINSGITVALVTKLTDLPTAAALQLALNAKQDTLTFDTEPTALSQNPVTSGGIYTAIQAIATALSDYSTTTDGRLGVLEGLIPSEAASSNKLTDKAYVDGLIQAITELIPAEATTTNQLADKAYVLASILAATPAFKGQFTTLAELQAVASPKDGDLGIVRTKDSDGMDVFTVYQYLNNAWNVFYSLSYHPQTKPATTGTTGDYPYNGMGRVELAKNMVNTGTELAPVYENQLTQDMFYKGAVGSRVPNTNTIFVIRYDYVLAENITIPDNCVLEFEGGSISGSYTITGANTGIQAGLVQIFNVNVLLAGTWNVAEAHPEWFGAKGDGVTDDTSYFNKVISFISSVTTDIKTIRLSTGIYCISEGIKIGPYINIIGIDKNSSIIKKTDVGSEDDAIIELLNGSGSTHYGRIEHITLSGISEQNPNTYGIQATKNSVPYLQIRDVNINGVKNGIYIEGGTWLCTMENIFIYEGEKGIYIHGSSTSCRLSNIYVLGMSIAAYDFSGIYYSICDTLCADFCHTNDAVYKIRFSNITFIGCASESVDSKTQIDVADGTNCTFLSSTFFQSDVNDGRIIAIYDGLVKFVNCTFGQGDTAHNCKIYEGSQLSTISFENCTVVGTFIASTGDVKLTVNDSFGFVGYKNKQSVLGPANSVPSELAPTQVVRAIYTDGLNRVSSSLGHSGWSPAFYQGDIVLNNVPSKTGVFGWESLNNPRVEKTLVGTISEVVASNRVKLTSLAYDTTSDDGVYISSGDVLTFDNGYAGEVTNVDYTNKVVTLWDPAGTAAVGEGGKLDTSSYRMKNKFTAIPMLGTGVSELRPASPEKGVCYFDETLGKPIWYNGSAWVDATGATV